MLITPSFVYVHMPKTGGTFVEGVLERIHKGRGDTVETVHLNATETPLVRLSRRLRTGNAHPPMTTLRVPPQPLAAGTIAELHLWYNGARNQHGRVFQIPPDHRNKPILTTFRNPYDLWVSHYEFRWWATHLDDFTRSPKAVLRDFPHFPDLSFAEFVRLANTHFIADSPQPHFAPHDKMGIMTRMFSRFYFTDPAAFSRMDRRFLAERRWTLSPTLRFIFMETLNRDLCAFLREVGYSEYETEFILDATKILPKEGGRSAEQAWERYYTPELKREIRHRERLLFEMFPHYDV